MPDYTKNYNFIKPKKTEKYDIDDVTRKNMDIADTELFNKQDKEPGKGLSTNDFTNAYKDKVDGFSNYDDTNIKKLIESNTSKIEQNTKDIESNETKIEDNTKAIKANTSNISKNTKNIENNTTAIKENAKNIQTNTDAIEENSKSIEKLEQENTSLKEELERQKEDAKLNGLTEDNEGELVHIENTTGARFNSLEIFGNEKQETREGKNLYNVRDTTGQAFNSSLKVAEDDTISLDNYTNTGTSTKWLDFRTNPEPKLQANKVYYIVTEIFSVSGNGILGVVTTNADNMGQFAQGVTYRFEDLNAGDIKVATATTREDLSACLTETRSYIQMNAGETGSIEFRISILEDEVTVEDFEYEKYGESPSFNYPSEVRTVENSINLKICNKNFLEITAENQTLNGVAIDIVGNKVTLNGTATKDFEFDLAKNFYLPAKNMFVSFKEEGSVDAVNCTYSLRNADNKQLLGYNRIGSSTNKTIVANDLGNNMRFFAFWITQGSVFTDFSVKIQIEAGNIGTETLNNEQQNDVIPVQQSMFSKDKFDLLNKKEKHYIKKLVLDGTHNIYSSKAVGTSIIQFGTNLGFYAKENPLAISNYFKQSKYFSVVNTVVIGSNLNTAYFHIPRESVEGDITDSAVQALLKQKADTGNPVTLWVEAEEPEQLDLTDEQIEVLEQIEQATTYKGVTNVYTEDEVGAIIKTNTSRDLNAIINNIQEQLIAE